MSQPTVILCPGQGAQHVGMGRDFVEISPAARETYQRAGEALGVDLASACFDGPDERLNRTDLAQPAIYVTSVACFRAAVEAGLVSAEGAHEFAGLSLGEYTALHLAGAIGFEDGLRLVASRGRWMQQAATAAPSGMVALVGADEAAVEALCAASAGGETLAPANYNAPGQIVVSGSRGACARLVDAASAVGFKAVPLAVAGAFHSPLMQSAADAMAAELAAARIAEPARPAWSNVTAAPHGDAESIRRLLVDQIVRPVRWEQTMRAMLERGVSRWIELAPGRVLTGLLRKLDRRAAVQSLASVDALKQGKESA